MKTPYRGHRKKPYHDLPHIGAVKATGRWAADYAINCNLATAYFELL